MKYLLPLLALLGGCGIGVGNTRCERFYGVAVPLVRVGVHVK